MLKQSTHGINKCNKSVTLFKSHKPIWKKTYPGYKLKHNATNDVKRNELLDNTCHIPDLAQNFKKL